MKSLRCFALAATKLLAHSHAMLMREMLSVGK
jgi:hypothetical protein